MLYFCNPKWTSSGNTAMQTQLHILISIPDSNLIVDNNLLTGVARLPSGVPTVTIKQGFFSYFFLRRLKADP